MLKIAVLFLLVLVACDAASLTPTCTTSYDCGSDSCCRSSSGDVLTNELGHFGFGPGFGPGPGPGTNGTCSMQKAQKGEVCDSSCKCDTGLECYRHMSGVCCPPMRCYDAAYVQQQKEYWAKCASNPMCFLPPRI